MTLPRSTAGLVAALLLAGAVFQSCAHRGTSPSGASLALPVASGENDPASGAGSSRTCPIENPSVSSGPFGDLIELGTFDGTTWIMAQASRDAGLQPVLLHLDAHGELVETELPEFTEYADFEKPARLHFLSPGSRTLAWSAELGRPSGVQVGRMTTLPSLLSASDGGFDSGARVKAFAVSGDRALISVYRHHYFGAGKSESFGETALYQRASLQRLGAVHPFSTWSAACGPRRCVGLASPNSDSNSAVLVEIDDSGEHHERLGNWGCAGWPSWRDGSKWLVAWLDDSKLFALSYDLETGQRRRASVAELPNPECAPLQAIEIAGRHGVVAPKKSFVPIDASANIGKHEPMPAMTERQQKYAPLPDAALVLDFTAEHAMVHSSVLLHGMQEFHSEWSFSGRSALLIRSERGLAVVSPKTLPRSGSEGEFGSVEVAALVHGSFSAAIVSEGRRAEILPLSRACP